MQKYQETKRKDGISILRGTGELECQSERASRGPTAKSAIITGPRAARVALSQKARSRIYRRQLNPKKAKAREKYPNI